MAKNVKFTSPHLPSLPREYDAYFFENIHKSLRIYFNQLENHLRATDVEFSGSLTVSGEIEGGSLDINGNADISGTLTSVTYQGDAIANAYIADLPTSKITSGTFADARIAASNVTQHQGSITGTGALNSGSITSGFTSIDIGSGALTAGATTLNGATTVNDDLLKVVSTDSGAVENPILALYRNSSSIAASDELGAVEFRGNDAEGAEFVYGRIYSELSVVGSGSEQANLRFALGRSGGFEDPVMTLRQYALELLPDNDLNLHARSQINFEGANSNSHETALYVVDPTQDNTVLLPDASGTVAIIDSNDTLEIVSTDAGATVNPIISLYRNSSSPALQDDLGAIQFYGQDDAGNKTLYAQIHGNIEDETHSGNHEDGQIHFACASNGSLEDPVMIMKRSSLQVSSNNDIILGQNSHVRFEGTSNNSFENILFTEDPTADREVNLPDASGVLEVGALASGAVVTGTSIAHATFSTYKGQKVVFTGSSNCTIQLPDVAAGDVGATWTVCNAGSANVIFDLNGSGSAQTLKILTGAAVTDVGTDDPHIVPGGVASLVCTAADNYILFGSGVVDN